MSRRDGHRLISSRSGWAVGLLLLGCGTATADEDLNTLRAAHRSARESIRTFSAKVTNERTIPKKQLIMVSTYSRSFDMIRIHTGMAGGTSDILIKGSAVRQVLISVKAKRKDYIARLEPRSSSSGLADAWAQMLLDFYRPDGGQVDLDRFLSLAKEPPRVSRERLHGVPCWCVRMSIKRPDQSEVHYVLWHDVTHNYLVRKIEMTFSSNSNSHFEAENTEFLEAAPGIFVPTRCVRRTRNGDYSSESATILSEVRVNQPIPESVFTLPAIPANTLLNDHIKGTRYRIDSQWQRTGPEEPLVTIHVGAPSPEDQTEYHAQSEREPRSTTWWLVPASLALLTCCGAAWGYRRYRCRQEDG